MKKTMMISLTMILVSVYPGWAKVDLVTLPARETVQLTIYNSADLTLAKESRALTLKEGENRLQFSWANTLIDPTSLELLPKAQASQIDVMELAYPPRVRELGLWTILSRISGKVPVEISYLTSGFTWRAFYMGTLSPDEKSMRLQGYVRVTNNSGEDYENAQTRLIVGKVHILDEISELARREYPYGRPQPVPEKRKTYAGSGRREAKNFLMAMEAPMVADAAAAPKEIKKEGLSEYYLYTIEGTETIPDGWSKRLPSFNVDEVPVENLYKYERERYGENVIRFLKFTNDEKHNMGEDPIPGGMLRVYHNVDDAGHLSYVGASSFKYIPVGEKAELNLGAVEDVIVTNTAMEVVFDNFMFDNKGDISGWDEIRTFNVKIRNTREFPAKIEITRNIPVTSWDLKPSGEYGEYEKIDLDTARFTFTQAPRTQREFTYILTTRHGRRAE